MINHTIYDAHNKNKSAKWYKFRKLYKLKCVQGQIASKSTNVVYRKSSQSINV